MAQQIPMILTSLAALAPTLATGGILAPVSAGLLAGGLGAAGSGLTASGALGSSTPKAPALPSAASSVTASPTPEAPSLPASTPGIGLSGSNPFTPPPPGQTGSQTGQNAVNAALSSASQGDPYGSGFN